MACLSAIRATGATCFVADLSHLQGPLSLKEGTAPTWGVHTCPDSQPHTLRLLSQELGPDRDTDMTAQHFHKIWLVSSRILASFKEMS